MHGGHRKSVREGRRGQDDEREGGREDGRVGKREGESEEYWEIGGEKKKSKTT